MEFVVTSQVSSTQQGGHPTPPPPTQGPSPAPRGGGMWGSYFPEGKTPGFFMQRGGNNIQVLWDNPPPPPRRNAPLEWPLNFDDIFFIRGSSRRVY